jgi:hypothetical protein
VAVEFMTLGVADGDVDNTFASIVDVTVDYASNEIFVLDALDHAIRVFSLNGKFLRKWGAEGDGPGDLRGPRRLLVARDSVLVVDRLGATLFARSGALVTAWRPGDPRGILVPVAPVALPRGWGMLAQVAIPGGTLSVTGLWRANDADTPMVTLSEEGSAATVLPSGRIAVPLFQAPRVIAADTMGRIYASAGGEYDITQFDASGVPIAIRRIAARRIPITEEHVQEYVDREEERCQAYRGPGECPLTGELVPAVLALGYPEHRPVIGELWVSGDGAIMVRRSDHDAHPFLPGDPLRLDFFGSDGSAMGFVTTPPGFTPTWFAVEPEVEVWGHRISSAGVPEVVAFRATVDG